MDMDTLEALADEAEALFLDPRDVFDAAIVGLTEAANGLCVVAYSVDGVLDALMAQNDGWTHEDAQEWYAFNILPAYMAGAPVFVDRLERP